MHTKFLGRKTLTDSYNRANCANGSFAGLIEIEIANLIPSKTAGSERPGQRSGRDYSCPA